MQQNSNVHSFKTDQGLQVWVRRLHRFDAPHLIEIFEHLSPDSRYLRFHEPLESPDPAFVRQQAREMAETTARCGRGWLAFADLPDAPATPIGGVRWVSVQDKVAEVALSVRDDLQGQGIGSELLRIAVLDARSAGIGRLVGLVHPSNQAVLKLLRDAPVPITRRFQAGELTIEADLTADIDWQLLEQEAA